MSKLVEAMKVLLADTFAFRIKAQMYHWNIEGPDFVQYHKFLGDIYTEADSNIDTIAEHIRALGSYAPGSFARFTELSNIKDEQELPNALEMLNRLNSDLKILHSDMLTIHTLSQEENQYGISNFIEGLIDSIEKTQWIFTSILKR